jgi:Zn-dependent metalloprotease
VHINSGIPNHAFYRTALVIGGNAWEKTGNIWYVTLRDKLRSNSDFQECADQTYQAAEELFGVGSLEQQAVKNGWQAVGISIGEGGNPPTDPGDGCFGSLLRIIGAAPARSR